MQGANSMSFLLNHIAKLLPLVLVSAAVAAAEPLVPPGYRLVCQTPSKFISVFCNGDLEEGKARKQAADVQAAYDFVAEAQQWRSRDPLTAPLHVHVDAAMKKGLLGFRAVAARVGLSPTETDSQAESPRKGSILRISSAIVAFSVLTAFACSESFHRNPRASTALFRQFATEARISSQQQSRAALAARHPTYPTS